MKKLINLPANMVDEMLEGIYAAHPGQVTCVNGDLRCLVTRRKHPGKVALATGGGSGHLPLFLGYVGEGMLDGCCVGGVFQSPSAERMLAVTKAIDNGAGVLYIYGNYGGNVMNFELAAEMAAIDASARSGRCSLRTERQRSATPRRSRHLLPVHDCRSTRSAKSHSGRGEGDCRENHRSRPKHGRGAFSLHHSRGRQADVFNPGW